jgi:short-subunit dehydrogenase
MALPAPREGATALVTGASSGIGAEIARALAGRGHGVTLTARREERLLELASELTDRHRVVAGVIAADIGAAEGRERLTAELERLELEVDVLVNNAGFGHTGDFVDAERERQVAMVALNCDAVVDLSARFLPRMVANGAGAVINIASTAAFQPLAGTATYAATKAFVLSFSEAVHSELKGTGVTVTAVCPGPVRTEFAEQAGIGGAEEKTPGLIWMSAEDLAAEAVKATEQGKRAVVPGLLNHAGSLLGRHTPRRFSLPLSRRLWRQVQ